MIKVEVHAKPRTFLGQLAHPLVAFFNDPYFYLLQAPNAGSLLLTIGLIIASISPIMTLFWMVVKRVSEGSFPHPTGKHFAMFFGMSFCWTFPIAAGIIHKYLTKPKYRGSAISFSQNLRLISRPVGDDNSSEDTLVFEIIDKRSEPLVAVSVSAIVAVREQNNPVTQMTMSYKQVPLKSPGIISIPTKIEVPLCDIFEYPLRCGVCGCEKFRNSFANYKAHMQFYHSVDAKNILEQEKSRNSFFHKKLNSVDSFTVTISGTDDISGRPATTSKEYVEISDETVVSAGKAALFMPKIPPLKPAKSFLFMQDYPEDQNKHIHNYDYSPVHVDFMYS